VLLGPAGIPRARSLLRASKSVLRPGRRDGGTTLVFTLKQGTVVRFTIVRVYPSCERIGSFSVRAHAGVNRVRFRGRVGGRPLAEGTYRLVAQARGQETAASTVTIVVVRRKTSSAKLRRARRANTCSASGAHEIDAAMSVAPAGSSNDGHAVKTKGKTKSLTDPVVDAAKAAVKKAKALPSAVSPAVWDNLSATSVVLIAWLLGLACALLWTVVPRVARTMGLGDPHG
jgi:hypothetical protein